VLLEPLDKSWKNGWTLILSAIAAFAVAVAVVADPRSIIESLVARWWKARFLREVRRQNLIEAFDTLGLEWKDCTDKEKIDHGSSLL
jgi:hypothetical protein